MVNLIQIFLQSSFGLSVTKSTEPTTASLSAAEAPCSADYIVIPSGQTETKAQTANTNPQDGATRYCGRYFKGTSKGTADTVATICSKFLLHSVLKFEFFVPKYQQFNTENLFLLAGKIANEDQPPPPMASASQKQLPTVGGKNTQTNSTQVPQATQAAAQ